MVPFDCTLDYIQLLSEVDLGSTEVTFVTGSDNAVTATVGAETVVEFAYDVSLSKGDIIKMKIDPTNAAEAIVYNLVFN